MRGSFGACPLDVNDDEEEAAPAECCGKSMPASACTIAGSTRCSAAPGAADEAEDVECANDAVDADVDSETEAAASGASVAVSA